MGRLTENRSTDIGVNPFSTRRIRAGAIDFLFEEGQSTQDLISKFSRSGFIGQIVGPHGSGKSTLLHELGTHLSRLAPLHRVQVQPVAPARFWQSLDVTCESNSLRDARGASLNDVDLRKLAPSRHGNPWGEGWVEGTNRQAIVAPHPDPLPGVPGRGSRRILKSTPFDASRKGIMLIDGFDSLGWLARTSFTRFCRRYQFGMLVATHRDLNLPTLYESRPNFSSFAAVVRQLQRGFPIHLSFEQIRDAYDSCFPNLRESLFQLYDRYEQQRRDRMHLATAK